MRAKTPASPTPERAACCGPPERPGAAGAWLPFWEAAPPDTLCFCFGHTESSIRAEIDGAGKTTAEARIRKRIKAGECACESLNPKGRCCLGDVGAFARSLENG